MAKGLTKDEVKVAEARRLFVGRYRIPGSQRIDIQEVLMDMAYDFWVHLGGDAPRWWMIAELESLKVRGVRTKNIDRALRSLHAKGCLKEAKPGFYQLQKFPGRVIGGREVGSPECTERGYFLRDKAKGR